MDNEALQKQFELLQEQQSKKLARRKQAKAKEKTETKPAAENTFGISDDLDLKLSDPPPPGSSYLSEELVNHLNEQIRELKDENGRLYKLLSERDFEIRQLKKKREEDKQAISGGGVASDQVATRIVELSKKVRELTAELESEKTKSKQYAKKCRDLQKEVDSAPQEGAAPPTARSIFTSLEDGKTYTEGDYKALLERSRQSEIRLTEARNQCQLLRNELKVAQKVITSECGEGVTIQSLVKEGSNWRGRAQQVIALQRKVTEMKTQLEQAKTQDFEGEMLGTTLARKATDNKQKEAIKRLEKERKEAQEKAQNDLKALEEEHLSVKEKLSASKARNKVLSNEVKSLKQHVQRLMEKSQHDDQLIDALMKQQTKLKSMVDESANKVKMAEKDEKDKVRHLAAKVQQDTNVTEQLRSIVQEKEALVKSLEEEIQAMRQMNLQKSQVEAANSLFERVASRTTSRHGKTSPSGSPNPVSRLSMRSVSRQSAILDGDSTDRPSSRWGTTTMENGLSKGSATDREALADLQSQVQEFKSLSQASEVERDKLLELVQVLQKRNDEATQRAQEATVDLSAQKKKVVLLEKQLGKAKLEMGQSLAKSGVKKVRGKTMDEDMLNENSNNSTNIEEIETRLEIQMDENEALKAALESTLKSKEEDLKMYNEMLEQTKRVFLQGIRQHRQNSAQ